MDGQGTYWVIYIILLSNSVCVEAESICSTQQDVSSVTLQTPQFPGWSTDDQCHCTLTVTNDVDLTVVVEQFVTDSSPDKDSCSPLLVFHLPQHTFFQCPGDRSVTSRLMLSKDGSTESPLHFRLYNPDGKQVTASVKLTSSGQESFSIICQSEAYSLDLDTCPCVDEYPTPVQVLPPAHQATPTSKRLLIGFMCALAFLVCVGIFLLISFLVRRDYIKPVGPLKYLVNREKLKDPYDNAKVKEAAVASNLGFVGDSQDSLHKVPRTPVGNSIHDMYATVDLSTAQLDLPFTPDPNLRLNLKSPYENEAGRRYRGSLDSGLYSEISSDKTDKQQHKGMNNSLPVLGATSLDTLQALGPGYAFEPPASQSSPKPPAKVDKEVEAIYAKPDKSRKSKYRNQVTGDTNAQPAAATGRSSNENLPGYRPQHLSPKSGSTGSLQKGQGMNLSGSKSGSVSMIPDPASAMASQPIKKKKKKKKKQNGEHTVSGSEQSLDVTGSRTSMENLSGYDPKPLQRRAGSSNSINGQLNLSGSVTMIPNVIYERGYPAVQNSRSSSELHMTDHGNDSQGSRVSMETDV